jgi:hypothetical protein
MSKVTIFSGGKYTVESLYQWDVGRELEIRGLSLAKAPEIHFTNSGLDLSIVRLSRMDAAGVIRVAIPDLLLQKRNNMIAYVCENDGENFKTLYKIDIPVVARNKPGDYIIVEDEGLLTDEILASSISNYIDKNVQLTYMRSNGEYIQFSNNNKDWFNVIAISDLKGAQGDPGKKGDVGPAGVHVGTEAPTDGQTVWIDTDEEPEEDGGNDAPVVVETAPPDFAANEGEDGYIANRTHYVDKNGVVHKLNNKYIDADWMATSEEVPSTIEVIAEQKITSGIWSKRQYDIQPGIIYDVHINGMIYPCEARAYGSNGAMLGNDSSLTLNDYPFCIMWAGGNATSGMFFKDDALSYPLLLKVTDHAYTAYNKLPEEFLPDSAAKKSDIPAPLIGTTEEVTPSEVAAALAEGRTVAITYYGGALGNITFTSFVIGEDAINSSETIGVTVHQLRGTLSTDMWSFTSTPVSGGADIDVTAEVGQTIVVKEVDANGKPTKWKAAEYQPRTHYKTETVVLPETTAEYSEEDSGFLIPFVELIGGAQYKIVYNGVEYVSEILDARENGENEILFGNIPMMTETGDNGIPFMGGMLTDGESGIGIVVPTDGAESVTISITQVEYTPIPVQYVTNAFPYYIEIIGSGTEDDPYVCNDTVANVRAIYESGRDIKVRRRNGSISYAEGYLIYNMLSVIKDSLYIQLSFGAVPENYIALLPNEDDSFTVSTLLD